MPLPLRARAHRGPVAAAVLLTAAVAAAVTAAVLGLGDSFLGPCRWRRARGDSIVRHNYEWDYMNQDKYYKPDPMKYQYLRWDPHLKGKTKDADHAAQIIMNTGKMPRPLKMSEIRIHRPPIKRVIVANKQERRNAAEMIRAFYIDSLQAKLMLKRDVHPVWGHERVVVYGKVLAKYLQPCADTNEPLEQDFSLKFKAAFREDDDPWAKDKESAWNREMENRGWNTRMQDGEALQPLMEKYDSDLKLEENMFAECIIDNVMDVGELVLQNFVSYVNEDVLHPSAKDSKIPDRIHKRLVRDLGASAGYKAEGHGVQYSPGFKPQELYDKVLEAKEKGWKAPII